MIPEGKWALTLPSGLPDTSLASLPQSICLLFSHTHNYQSMGWGRALDSCEQERIMGLGKKQQKGSIVSGLGCGSAIESATPNTGVELLSSCRGSLSLLTSLAWKMSLL